MVFNIAMPVVPVIQPLLPAELLWLVDLQSRNLVVLGSSPVQDSSSVFNIHQEFISLAGLSIHV